MQVQNFAKTTSFAARGLSFETALDRNMEIIPRWLFCSRELLKNNLMERFFFFIENICLDQPFSWKANKFPRLHPDFIGDHLLILKCYK